ncbi:MAG: hypothetical protein ACRDCB_10775 [Clostridium sp.]|nr:hypothetical protein [Clostridium sp. LY3-2]
MENTLKRRVTRIRRLKTKKKKNLSIIFTSSIILFITIFFIINL